ncbi:MAG: sensor histidine kinase [Bdellovibrionia bacterium]
MQHGVFFQPEKPSLRPFRLMLLAQFLWFLLLALLVGWWGKLALRQASRIAELEQALGQSASQTQAHWGHVQAMLFWESGAFFVLLAASSGLLLWLFWRDHLRARGVQAFFASLTHELRTPLTGIRLQAESMADYLAASRGKQEASFEVHPKLLQLSQRLLDDTMRLQSQVDRTLELARVEGGGPVFIQPLQLKPWLEQFLRSGSVPDSARFQIRLNVPDVWMEADPAALQVIFKNILENSIKHSGQHPVAVSLDAFLEGPWIRIQIQDDGQGYLGDPRLLGQLFQKGASSTGTGVGLYLVQALMKRMGGKVRFLTVPGFQVQLTFPQGGPHE